MILSGIRLQLAADTGVAALVPAKRIFKVMAERSSARPYIVIHGINLPPAATTLKGSSELRDGEFQFDSYSDNATDARSLSNTVQVALQDLNATLPDGSTIQFVGTTADFDDGYEVGGTSFLFRSVLRMKAFYTEA
jgi:hypothetical protein